MDPYFFFAQCSARKKYEFLFFLNSYFFWNPYFLWHYVGPGKSMNSFFLEPILFFGTMLGPKKYESECPFFVTHTFLGTFFLAPIFFWHNFWPEKNRSSFFFWN